MAKVTVTLNHSIYDGMAITFVAPCDCDKTDGLRVIFYEEDRDDTRIQDFEFKDAHGNVLTGLGNLFLKGAYVRVILDTMNWVAYIQNADTNGYLEGKLTALGVEDNEHPGCFYRVINGKTEWLNPPMELGVEYRTTERWLGKVVYTKLFDYGTLPTPEEGYKNVYFTEYTDSNREGIQVHEISGRLGENDADSGSTSLTHFRAVEYVYATGNRVTIKSSTDYTSGKTVYAYIQVKYTKRQVADY